MTNGTPDLLRRSIRVLGLMVLVALTRMSRGQPTSGATSSYNAYIAVVEKRLAWQHRSQITFLDFGAADAHENERRMRAGELIVERVAPSQNQSFPGALLHHWRGTAFQPRAKAEDFERVLRDFGAYPHYYLPEVLQARVLSQKGDQMQGWMRVRQRHGISVVLDSTYNLQFGQLDDEHGYSVSRSEQIKEIEAAGTTTERPLTEAEEHGFLWRQNTYWSYEERDGGLYLQIESISLSRSIPVGLGWAIAPFVESIPRESMEFTLRSTCRAIGK